MQQKIRFCHTVDGVRIAYSKMGSGPPLVKASNWLSHLEYDGRSPVWRHWYEYLSKHFTLIRYDPRGCGLSDREVPEFSLSGWLCDLEAVVNALGLERFPLIALSQGGPVSIAYAQRHPKKITHLILYGSYARGRLKRELTEQQREETRLLIKLIRLGWGNENPAFRQVFTTLFIPDGTLEQQQWFNELQKVSTSPDNAVEIVNSFDSIDVSHLAPQITAPTLVLHAKGDARIAFEEGRLLASLIPGAQFFPLESKNHILLDSEPAWQLFCSEVLAFLQTNPLAEKTEGVVFSRLTRREHEVLNLIASGMSNTSIAEQLHISPKTVRNHITSIFRNLGVRNRAEAIVCARDAGMGKKLTW